MEEDWRGEEGEGKERRKEERRRDAILLTHGKITHTVIGTVRVAILPFFLDSCPEKK